MIDYRQSKDLKKRFKLALEVDDIGGECYQYSETSPLLRNWNFPLSVSDGLERIIHMANRSRVAIDRRDVYGLSNDGGRIIEFAPALLFISTVLFSKKVEIEHDEKYIDDVYVDGGFITDLLSIDDNRSYFFEKLCVYILGGEDNFNDFFKSIFIDNDRSLSDVLQYIFHKYFVFCDIKNLPIFLTVLRYVDYYNPFSKLPTFFSYDFEAVSYRFDRTVDSEYIPVKDHPVYKVDDISNNKHPRLIHRNKTTRIKCLSGVIDNTMNPVNSLGVRYYTDARTNTAKYKLGDVLKLLEKRSTIYKED